MPSGLRSPRGSPPQAAGQLDDIGDEHGRPGAWALVPWAWAMPCPACAVRIARIEGQAEQVVRLSYGREPAGQGDGGTLSGELGEAVGDQGRGGRAGACP
jgi:hypothetical protein